MIDPRTAGAREIAEAIRMRHVSSSEIVAWIWDRIRRHGPAVNAVITLDEEGARRRARDADAALERGELWGPLHGVPVTLKDCHSTAGMRTTAGFPPLADHVPTEDGTVAARLKAAGAILIGKTNVPPLLGQPQSDNPIFGRTNNPWDLARTPGGSSGGAAAALAAGMSFLDIGSDLAGSIRMPAHFCGIYGLKPTVGRIPMTGHIPDPPGRPRFDRVLGVSGPMARSVDDLILAFTVLAGPDGRDTEVSPRSIASDVPFLSMRELRIAWAPTFPGTPVAASIAAALRDFAAELSRDGAHVREALPEIDFDEMRALWKEYYMGFAFVMREVWGVPTSATAPSAPPTLIDLMRINDRRDRLIRAWDSFHEEWDVFLCPAAIVTAFPHCAPGSPISVDGAIAPYGRINHHCFPFNITGQPAAVIPIGRDPGGLPIGAQIVGRRWADERLLAITARLAVVAGPFRSPPGFPE